MYASTKRPRLAEGARKQLARTLVTQDALRLRVPFDLAPHQKRDETQMPGKGGMMRHYHWRHRGLARLDGVEEVAKVSTLGKRQFHLALVLPEQPGVSPLLVRGFKGIAAIDPYPAVRADPLG